MDQIVSRLIVIVIMLASVTGFASCGLCGNKKLESNWRFDAITSDGKTLTASDFNEDNIPMIIIDKDKLNEGYYVCLRTDGINRYGWISQKEDVCNLYLSESDDDMIVKVSGNKLTLTNENKDDYSIVFKYTNDKIMIPVEEKMSPDHIKARMYDNCKVAIKNEGRSTYLYGLCYQLEFQKNGKWYYARYLDHIAWTNLGYYLDGGTSCTMEYDLSYYGKLEPGEYRLAVCDLDAPVYAYFTVNKDGSFSYPE